MAKETGAGILVFHGPTRSSDLKANCASAAGLCQMARAARQQDVILTLEHSLGEFCGTPGQMADVVLYDDGGNLGITLDLYKALAAGYFVEDFLQVLAGRMCHFHFCDKHPGIEERLMPG